MRDGAVTQSTSRRETHSDLCVSLRVSLPRTTGSGPVMEDPKRERRGTRTSGPYKDDFDPESLWAGRRVEEGRRPDSDWDLRVQTKSRCGRGVAPDLVLPNPGYRQPARTFRASGSRCTTWSLLTPTPTPAEGEVPRKGTPVGGGG